MVNRKHIFISMKVPRDRQDLLQAATSIVAAVLQAGHAPFLAFREIEYRGLKTPKEFMPFVREQIKASDLLLLLYDPEIRGGLVEAGIAYADGIPLWLLHKQGEAVSSSVKGIASKIIAFESAETLEAALMDLLKE